MSPIRLLIIRHLPIDIVKAGPSMKASTIRVLHRIALGLLFLAANSSWAQQEYATESETAAIASNSMLWQQ